MKKKRKSAILHWKTLNVDSRDGGRERRMGMKRIIDKKVYDTETATEIAYDSYSSPGDFSYFCETLYKTKKGSYFMHGEGGPKSDYAQSVGNNSTSGSSRIWTIDEERAKEFVAKNDPEKALKLWSFEEG